jgi:hypothetical protein
MKKKLLVICYFLIQGLSSDVFTQIQFTPFIISSNTQSTEGLYICDIDGDNRNDIIGAAAENDHKVIWWRNEGGDPVQWTKIIIDDNFLGAGYVYAADLNNDLHIDVIACAKLGNQIAWYENSGGSNITWTKHIIQSGYIFPHEVFACDLDKDGYKDVLAVSSTLGEITWWKNSGGNPINWTRFIIATNFSGAKSVHVGDFNGDSLPDVVAAGILNNKISWWENDGHIPISWIEHVVSNNFIGAHRVQAVDLNNDGKLDILGAAYYGNEIAWWKNEGGNPIIWTKQTIASNFTNVCIAIAVNIDNFGNFDVVGTAQNGNEVSWWRNDGGDPIVWTKFVIDGNFYRVWPICAGDLDGDGDTDIVAASGVMGNNEVKWYRSNLVIGIKKISSSEVIIRDMLYNNYPNPFNPSTQITFDIVKSSFVRLKIYDILGKEVATLINKKLQAGKYEVPFSINQNTKEQLPSGVYFYKLITDDYTKTKKMVLMK